MYKVFSNFNLLEGIFVRKIWIFLNLCILLRYCELWILSETGSSQKFRVRRIWIQIGFRMLTLSRKMCPNPGPHTVTTATRRNLGFPRSPAGHRRKPFFSFAFLNRQMDLIKFVRPTAYKLRFSSLLQGLELRAMYAVQGKKLSDQRQLHHW